MHGDTCAMYRAAERWQAQLIIDRIIAFAEVATHTPDDRTPRGEVLINKRRMNIMDDESTYNHI